MNDLQLTHSLSSQEKLSLSAVSTRSPKKCNCTGNTFGNMKSPKKWNCTGNIFGNMK